MSLARKTGKVESVTLTRNALAFFMDRNRAVRLFCQYLNDDPPRERILYVHADGGNGKTLLLHFLQARCCKRLDRENWDYLQALPDPELFKYNIAHAPHELIVPNAALDFTAGAQGEETSQQTFPALLKLRSQLQPYGINFHLFDYAAIIYLKMAGRLSKETLEHLFPSEEIDLIFGILDMAARLPGLSFAKAVLGLFDKHAHEKIQIGSKKRRIDGDDLERIRGAITETEMLDLLPELFANDLNKAVIAGQAERIALFFDGHEAFWGNRRNLSDGMYFERDEWFRHLLLHLELGQGIVAVVAGRELPKWSNAPKYDIPSDVGSLDCCIEPCRVGHLSDREAWEYLDAVGVPEGPLRKCLLAHARVARKKVHPLYLGLCADVVRAAFSMNSTLSPEDFLSSGAPRIGRVLLARLFHYVDLNIAGAVHALSACRAFDPSIYTYLGRALTLNGTPAFQTSHADFAVLTGFSFVARLNRTDGDWYRIHDLIRRLVAEQEPALTLAAHGSLERYYRGRMAEGDRAAVVEALYHANKTDWKPSVEEWTEIFLRSLGFCDYNMCRALRDVHTDLTIQSSYWRGRTLAAIAEFFDCQARWSEAEQAYRQAMAAFDRALDEGTDGADAYGRKGDAIRRIGGMHHQLSRYDSAERHYLDAIRAFDTALQHDSHDVHALINRGNALKGLAGLYVELHRINIAIDTYNETAAAFDRALECAPSHLSLRNDRGVSFLGLGEVQMRRGACEDALGSYTVAVETFDVVLRESPDYVYAHSNHGRALRGRANAYSQLGRDIEAEADYRAAIAAFDLGLAHAPDAIYVRNNRGDAIRNLGEFEAAHARPEAAAAHFVEAIAAFDKTLDSSPSDVSAYNYKGHALCCLGDLDTASGRMEDALARYHCAVAACAKALHYAPQSPLAYRYMGMAQRGRGAVQAAAGQPDAALESYALAAAAYRRAGAITPDDPSIVEALIQVENEAASLRGA